MGLVIDVEKPKLPPDDVVSFTLVMDRRVYNKITETANASGLTFAAFIRNSLKVYNFCSGETRKGKQILIGQNDIPKQELLLK